jgi:hypothetical protein
MKWFFSNRKDALFGILLVVLFVLLFINFLRLIIIDKAKGGDFYCLSFDVKNAARG